MALVRTHPIRPASVVLCLAAASLLQAQDDHGTQINDYVRTEMVRRQIPGVALQVLRGHRVVFAANYGTADRSTMRPVTEATSFEVASITKQFTDAAVLLLVDQGMLAVTDPLSKYLPDLPPAWQPITVQQLMYHTAGLRDDWDEADDFFISKTTVGEYLEALKASPLKYAPGTDWSYGCGPFVLGLVIERLTGMSYAEFMRKSIFGPLGMASSDINDGSVSAPDRASGFVVRGGAIQSGARISLAARARADVGVRTTAHDLALWNAALDGSSLLSAASRRLMFTPGRLTTGEVIAHGFGWHITPFRGHTEIAHGGSFRTGFNAYVARYPDDGLTIILLTNQYGARSSEMVRAIASFYNGDYRPIPMLQPKSDRNPSRTELVAQILNALRAGTPPKGMLSDVGRLAGWSRSELREELAHASVPVFIDCQRLSGAKAFGTPVLANCFYRTDGDRPRYWTVSYTADGRVAYLELEQ
jgi:CubicO group peptidase (beta-lactamase class C family)